MELHKRTIHETLELLKKKEVTYEDVVSSYVNRMDQVEGKIDAALKTMPDEALARAKELDKEGAEPEGLKGIPYGLKDNICTLDIETTSASKMLYNFVPPYNATVVEKLEDAGAILLGKMNMDEFGMGSSTEKSHVKTTRNPWDLNRVPGGSSGGSAAGVAAGEIAYSLGSDAGGSIRQPASFSGVVGLKPTYGLVSRYGLIGFSSSLEQIGPITKDVKDSAIVLNTIAGKDPKDTMSISVEKKDYTSCLSKDIKGLKIGIPKEYFQEGLNPEVEKAVTEAIKLYKEMGAEIVETSLPTTEHALSAYYIISSAEASSDLARYDGLRYGYQAEEYDGLKDLYIKSRSQGFGTEIKMRILLGTYALTSEHYDAYYKKALQVRTLVKEDLNKVFETCDIILSPTSPTTAFPIGEKINDPLTMYLSDIYTIPANIAGIPGISLPCGFDSNGLPIGLQLMGNAFREETILKAAYAYEQEAGHFMKKASL